MAKREKYEFRDHVSDTVIMVLERSFEHDIDDKVVGWECARCHGKIAGGSKLFSEVDPHKLDDCIVSLSERLARFEGK